MTVRELGHLVLYVRDVERSAAFYRDVLGWPQIIPEPGERPVGVAAFSSGRTHHELLLIEVGADATAIPQGRRIGLYHFGLNVGETDDDLRAALVAVKAAGATVVGASDHTVTHSLYIEDPTATRSSSMSTCRAWTGRPIRPSSARPFGPSGSEGAEQLPQLVVRRCHRREEGDPIGHISHLGPDPFGALRWRSADGQGVDQVVRHPRGQRAPLSLAHQLGQLALQLAPALGLQDAPVGRGRPVEAQEPAHTVASRSMAGPSRPIPTITPQTISKEGRRGHPVPVPSGPPPW